CGGGVARGGGDGAGGLELHAAAGDHALGGDRRREAEHLAADRGGAGTARRQGDVPAVGGRQVDGRACARRRRHSADLGIDGVDELLAPSGGTAAVQVDDHVLAVEGQGVGGAVDVHRGGKR